MTVVVTIVFVALSLLLIAHPSSALVCIASYQHFENAVNIIMNDDCFHNIALVYQHHEIHYG
jgi:hypothetical protein